MDRLAAEMFDRRINALEIAQKVDLKRRRDVCSGVIRCWPTNSFQIRAVQSAVDHQVEIRDRTKPVVAFLLLIGGLLHWYLGQDRTSMQLPVGGFLLLCSAAAWWHVDTKTSRLRSELQVLESRALFLRQTFLSAGATDSNIDELSRLVCQDSGEIDYESNEYIQWWIQLQDQLLCSVDEQPSSSYLVALEKFQAAER